MQIRNGAALAIGQVRAVMEHACSDLTAVDAGTMILADGESVVGEMLRLLEGVLELIDDYENKAPVLGGSSSKQKAADRMVDRRLRESDSTSGRRVIADLPIDRPFLSRSKSRLGLPVHGDPSDRKDPADPA